MQRRNLFCSRLSEELTERLDTVFTDFLVEHTCFDEVLLLQIADDGVLPQYDFSYRDEALVKPSQEELVRLLTCIELMQVGEFVGVSSSYGSEFDVLVRVAQKYYLAINNTALSLSEIIPVGQDISEFLTPKLGPMIEIVCKLVKELT